MLGGKGNSSGTIPIGSSNNVQGETGSLALQTGEAKVGSN